MTLSTSLSKWPSSLATGLPVTQRLNPSTSVLKNNFPSFSPARKAMKKEIGVKRLRLTWRAVQRVHYTYLATTHVCHVLYCIHGNSGSRPREQETRIKRAPTLKIKEKRKITLIQKKIAITKYISVHTQTPTSEPIVTQYNIQSVPSVEKMQHW